MSEHIHVNENDGYHLQGDKVKEPLELDLPESRDRYLEKVF